MTRRSEVDAAGDAAPARGSLRQCQAKSTLDQRCLPPVPSDYVPQSGATYRSVAPRKTELLVLAAAVKNLASSPRHVLTAAKAAIGYKAHMDLLTHYAAMARYNRWMNESLYAHAAPLTDEQRKRDVGAFFGSLFSTLDHILAADKLWLSRFGAGDPPKPRFPKNRLHDDFEALSADRRATDEAIVHFIASLEADALDQEMRYANLRGEPWAHPTWWAVSHFLNHGVHHRGQATTILMQLGVDPGATDMIAMLRAEKNG